MHTTGLRRLRGLRGLRGLQGLRSARVAATVALAVVAVLGAATLVLSGAWGGSRPPSVPSAPAAPDAPAAPSGLVALDRSRVLVGLQVLRRWDERRAAAWAAGDVEGLAALSVRGSPAGRRDRAMLAAYVGRGLVVNGLRQQVLGVEAVAVTSRRVTLDVTDRLSSASVAGRGLRRRLPSGQATNHRVELVRNGGRWRMAAVTRAPP